MLMLPALLLGAVSFSTQRDEACEEAGVERDTALSRDTEAEHGLLGLLTRPIRSEQEHVSPDDERFHYEGRWVVGAKEGVADWPCAAVHFAATGPGSATVVWRAIRTRVSITVYDDHGHEVSSDIFASAAFRVAETRSTVRLPGPGPFRVVVRKLTQGQPYGPGLGGSVLSPSVLHFGGARLAGGARVVAAPLAQPRRIEFLGASDTAGFCVDGTPATSDVRAVLTGWKYDNCALASPGLLGRRLDAEVHVEAIAGIGLTQNADHGQRWKLGALTMNDYFNRTLQTSAAKWNFKAWVPEVVVVSLGGNDYNHQGLFPGSEAERTFTKQFIEAYVRFLESVFERYASAKDLTVLSTCGEGSPLEAKEEPDNNRCRPCEHVQEGVARFRELNPTLNAEFLLVPCDGTVVQDAGDIGCMGHKSRKGMAKVADFVEPTLREILSRTA